MKKMMIHNPFFRLLVPPIAGIFLYLLILLFNNSLQDIGLLLDSKEVYITIALAYLMSESQRLVIIMLAKHESTRDNLYIHLFSGLLVTVILISIGISTYFQLVYDFSIAQSQLIMFNMVFGFASLLYSLLHLSQMFLYKENTRQLSHEQSMLDDMKRQLVQYKNEVNPDLLYDCLETLVTLVHKNTEESEDYIDELASVYRYILSSRKTEFSQVNHDLRMAKSIAFLLNYQHSGAISLVTDLPDHIESSPIIPGTLPTVVEQIIRSTIVSTVSPLEIRITYEKDENYLIIQHRLNERLRQQQTASMARLQESYAIYSEKPLVQVRAYEQEFVKIPLPKVVEEPLTSTTKTAFA